MEAEDHFVDRKIRDIFDKRINYRGYVKYSLDIVEYFCRWNFDNYFPS